jgi:hypothetical protein
LVSSEEGGEEMTKETASMSWFSVFGSIAFSVFGLGLVALYVFQGKRLPMEDPLFKELSF